MPNALVKKYAEKAKCSVEHVEEVWSKAKEVAKERFKGTTSPSYWAYVNAITQRGLKLKEYSFKKFSQFTPDMEAVPPDMEVAISSPAEPQAAPPLEAPQPEAIAPEAPAEVPAEPQVVPAQPEPEVHVGGGKLVSMLFGARDWAHTLHLKTSSHAAHLALGELYTELVDLADGFAETAQGKHGLLSVLACSSEFVDTDERGFISKLASWLETEGRACIEPTDTYLLNQLDEILAAVYRAKYKLENLK